MPGTATGKFLNRAVLLVGVVALALLLWQVADILLLAFAGMLGAVLLRTLVLLLERVLPLSERWAFAGAILLVLAVVVLLVWFLAPRLGTEVDRLRQGIPVALKNVEAQLEQVGWGQSLLRGLPSLDQLDSNVLGRLPKTFSTSLSVLVNIVFVVFVSLFLAANPRMYRAGLLQLVPSARRKRTGEVLSELVATLRWWLLGQLIAMLVIGVLVGLGLWLLGMPFALSVGVIAGVLEFIPFLGPLLSGALAVLLAFVQGPQQALYVLVFYVVIEQVEGNLLIPIIHRYTVKLAPVLTLTAVLVVGALFGFVGIFVATPLVAVALVLVKMLYIQDVLGDSTELPRKMFKNPT